MQIIFRATTATTVAAGGVITTNGVQVLPAWAPPIQYIGTTVPWLAYFLSSSTQANAGFPAKSKFRPVKVRAYGRSASLHAGREVVACAQNIHAPSKVSANGISAQSDFLVILTYRAVGELIRP